MTTAAEVWCDETKARPPGRDLFDLTPSGPWARCLAVRTSENLAPRRCPMSVPEGLCAGGRALWSGVTDGHDLDPVQLVTLTEARVG